MSLTTIMIMNILMTMINPKDIQSLWDNMRTQQTAGMLKRKLQLNSPFIVNCLYKYPENFCGIALTFSNTITPNVRKYQQWKTFDVQLFPDSAYQNTTMMMVMLTSPGKNDAFAMLCSSLISKIEKASNENEAVKLFVNQLEEWRRLFEKTYKDGLGKGAQKGLWGEMHMLETLLTKTQRYSQEQIVDWWVGSQKSPQDFQGDNWSIEIKATSKNNDSVVDIHGERQLDETHFANLYLNRVTLNETPQNGISLPEKIDKVKSLIQNDLLALTLLEQKLAQYGYLDSMRNMYDTPTYQIRNNQYFKVEGNFPRIKEGETRAGVSNITYSIDLNLVVSYEKQEDFIISNIK